MRQRLIVILSVLTQLAWHIADAQRLIAAIETHGKKIDSLSASTFGDSVLLGYHDIYYGSGHKTFRWVTEEGEVGILGSAYDFVKVARSQPGYCIYYLDPIDKGHLKVCRYVHHMILPLPGEISIPGNIVGSFVADDFLIISYDKSTTQLYITRLRDDHILGQAVFVLPNQFAWDLQHNDVMTVHRSSSWSDAFQRHGSTCLYLRQDEVWMARCANHSLDILKMNFISNKSSGTETLLCEGTVANIVDSTIFDFSVAKGDLTLEARDLGSGALRGSLEKLSEEDLRTVYYVRGVAHNFIRKEHGVSNIEDSVKKEELQKSFAVDRDGIVFLRCGTEGIPPLGSAPVFVPFGPFALFTALYDVGAIVSSSVKPKEYSSYFYASFDGSGLALAPDTPGNVLQEVDEWELDQYNKGVRFTTKYYVDFKGGLLGFYMPKKEKKIEVVEFR